MSGVSECDTGYPETDGGGGARGTDDGADGRVVV
jgi:hypothetical protein